MTGGSSGLGLALAILLTRKGADVSIIARNKDRLEKALEELEVRLFLTIPSILSILYLPECVLILLHRARKLVKRQINFSSPTLTMSVTNQALSRR